MPPPLEGLMVDSSFLITSMSSATASVSYAASMSCAIANMSYAATSKSCSASNSLCLNGCWVWWPIYFLCLCGCRGHGLPSCLCGCQLWQSTFLWHCECLGGQPTYFLISSPAADLITCSLAVALLKSSLYVGLITGSVCVITSITTCPFSLSATISFFTGSLSVSVATSNVNESLSGSPVTTVFPVVTSLVAKSPLWTKHSLLYWSQDGQIWPVLDCHPKSCLILDDLLAVCWNPCSALKSPGCPPELMSCVGWSPGHPPEFFMSTWTASWPFTWTVYLVPGFFLSFLFLFCFLLYVSNFSHPN